jgi:hypothetical protein
MLGKVTLAAGLLTTAVVFAPIEATAAPALRSAVDGARGSLVEKVQRRGHHRHRFHGHRSLHFHGHRRHYHGHYRRYWGGGGVVVGYCAAWRNECAARWGWGTGPFYRCLWRHGC